MIGVIEMKNKGAVPIAYIIALLLGIAVIAVIGYWFFIVGGQLGGEVTITQCRARAQNYCNSWKVMSYGTDDVEEGGVIVSSTPKLGWFSDRYLRCSDFEKELGFTPQVADNYETNCRNLINDLL